MPEGKIKVAMNMILNCFSYCVVPETFRLSCDCTVIEGAWSQCCEFAFAEMLVSVEHRSRVIILSIRYIKCLPTKHNLPHDR
jgi:hypothetical protein